MGEGDEIENPNEAENNQQPNPVNLDSNTKLDNWWRIIDLWIILASYHSVSDSHFHLLNWVHTVYPFYLCNRQAATTFVQIHPTLNLDF